MIERWIDSRVLYQGKIISVRVGEAQVNGGATATREVVEHPGGVAVVPVIDDCVLLVRQYRIAVGREVLEIPAGKLEGPEEPLQRGMKELEEETGYRAGRMVPIGSVYASVGYTSEEIHMYLGFDLEFVGQNLEFDECVELVRVPLGEIGGRLARNEFKDAKTVVGLCALLRHLGKQAGGRSEKDISRNL